jgi:hypothetical protein
MSELRGAMHAKWNGHRFHDDAACDASAVCGPMTGCRTLGSTLTIRGRPEAMVVNQLGEDFDCKIRVWLANDAYAV